LKETIIVFIDCKFNSFFPYNNAFIGKKIQIITDDPASGITYRGSRSQKFYVLSGQDGAQNNK
jgi:hypothetical protein